MKVFLFHLASVLPLLLLAAETSDQTLTEQHTAVSFAQEERAREQIDPSAVDADVIAAAIFFETNKRRIAEGLTPLKPMPKVREAAAMQAGIMKKRGVIAHVNPDRPERNTPWQRLQKIGLEPGFAAENVATEFLLHYDSGEPFYARVEDGRQLYSYQPEGEPIQPHTYLSFAETLVESWMNSPEHRKNIVDARPEYLGCAAHLSRREGSMDVFYCVQVFFTPRSERTP